MFYKRFIILAMPAFLFGCIGKNPDDATTTTNTTTATTAATPAATTTTKTATTGALGTEPTTYKIRTISNSQLQLYFQGYANDNVTLEKRDEDATESRLADILKALPQWSAETTKWTDQYDTPSGTPSDSANIHILNDKGGSVISADGKHLVQNLTMDNETGLYIPSETSVLAAAIIMGEKSWIDVRGKMGSARFDMNPKSIVDLTNGYGLLLNSKLTEIKYNETIDPTGVLTLEPDGELRIDNGTITLHKADIKGSLGVNNATFNFQTRRDTSTTNIGFFQTKGKVYSLDSDTFPNVMMTVNGPFQFRAGSEIEVLINADTASKIMLHFPFSLAGDSDKPVIEGKIRFIPKGVESLKNTSGNGILIINSNIGFSPTMDLSQLIADNTVLKKRLSINVAPITDEKFKGRQGIFLKIENSLSSLALKATTQIQTAVDSLKHAELKAAVWNTDRWSTTGNIGSTQVFATQSTISNDETSAVSKLFGLQHSLDYSFGNIELSQLFNRVQVADSSYRFIPQSQTPFWIMQHNLKFKTPFNLGNFMLTPSAGVSHLMIPNTLFQDGFQSLNPEMSVKLGVTHVVDSATLSMNLMTQAQYQTFNQTPLWGINTGLNISVSMPLLNMSTGVLNPFQAASEMYIIAQFDF